MGGGWVNGWWVKFSKNSVVIENLGVGGVNGGD